MATSLSNLFFRVRHRLFTIRRRSIERNVWFSVRDYNEYPLPAVLVLEEITDVLNSRGSWRIIHLANSIQVMPLEFLVWGRYERYFNPVPALSIGSESAGNNIIADNGGGSEERTQGDFRLENIHASAQVDRDADCSITGVGLPSVTKHILLVRCTSTLAYGRSNVETLATPPSPLGGACSERGECLLYLSGKSSFVEFCSDV